jgi:hypothetical protein
MPRVGFEPTFQVLEWEKTVHALDRATTVIGTTDIIHSVIINLLAMIKILIIMYCPNFYETTFRSLRSYRHRVKSRLCSSQSIKLVSGLTLSIESFPEIGSSAVDRTQQSKFLPRDGRDWVLFRKCPEKLILIV